MPYGQKNYNDPQGIPPTKYRIHDIGCFITSFCNLLERFSYRIDPPTINNFFRDKNLYIDVDDGVRDDVSWDFVTKLDPNTVVSGVGVGRPPNNNCIVKFVYNGGSSTHFCLVNDVNSGTIIDSWDGVVKGWDAYGGPKAWASYVHNGESQKGETMNAATVELLYQVFGVPYGKNDIQYFTGRSADELVPLLNNNPAHKAQADKLANADKGFTQVTEPLFKKG